MNAFSLPRLRNVLEQTGDRPLSDVIGLVGDALRQWKAVKRIRTTSVY
ncbi:MAG: hypothetical protein R3F37_19755 [Candidatus Competibacteraceae bacterium]